MLRRQSDGELGRDPTIALFIYGEIGGMTGRLGRVLNTCSHGGFRADREDREEAKLP
jgi:hypothetical protein